MPPPKKKQTSSLGRAVIKSRFQGQKAIALDEGKLVSEVNFYVKVCFITYTYFFDYVAYYRCEQRAQMG